MTQGERAAEGLDAIMKLDNAEHPVSQMAMRVFFGCFLAGMGVVATYMAMKHPLQSVAFDVVAGMVIFLATCSLVTYFRPRGLAAYVTSTAYVGLIIGFGMFEADDQLPGLPVAIKWIIACAVVGLWIGFGIRRARATLEEGREMDQGGVGPLGAETGETDEAE